MRSALQRIVVSLRTAHAAVIRPEVRPVGRVDQIDHLILVQRGVIATNPALACREDGECVTFGHALTGGIEYEPSTRLTSAAGCT